ncbi:DUF924 family protein [Cystobacter fuscus]|uniref:DUF924 family protein n=1 Tax=Cystobacter fuscus TaxID=43 RepID=UPI0037C0741F
MLPPGGHPPRGRGARKESLPIVARFGRFPHRNAALSRKSTPEEMAFLQEPDSAF